MKCAVRLAALLAATGIFAIASEAWASGTPAAPPTVALIGPNPLTEHLTKLAKDTYRVVFALNIENDGFANIPYAPSGHGGFNIGIVSDRDYPGAALPPTIAPAGKDVSLPGMSVSRIPVMLVVHDQDTTSLQVVLTVTAPSGVVPSTEAIMLTRSPLGSNFVGILLGSLIVGLAIIAVFYCFRDQPADKVASNVIYTDSTFSFGQSWATNIAAILTVVATVFSTTGVLSDLIPGIDTGFFLAVTITYGVVLALAPLAYSIFQVVEHNHVYGSRLGFQAAAAITGIAVGGQLATAGAIIILSDNLSFTLRVGLLAFLGVVAVAVIAYTEATRRQLWRLQEPESAVHPAATDGRPLATMAAFV